jgi:hypothetical protein
MISSTALQNRKLVFLQIMKVISHIFLVMMKKMRISMHLRKRVMKSSMQMMRSMWALVEDRADDVVGLGPSTEVVIVGCQGASALGVLVVPGIVELLVVSANWGLREGVVVAVVEVLADHRTLNRLSVWRQKWLLQLLLWTSHQIQNH